MLREWGRIGCIGFGGPPAHIALLRQLCVDRRQWLDAEEFEDAIGACNLLPGPASTELAIFCAWRVRGRRRAGRRPGLHRARPRLHPRALRAVPRGHAAAVGEGGRRWGGRRGGRGRGPGRLAAARAQLDARAPGRAGPPVPLAAYLLACAPLAAATIGPWLVLVLLGCGVTELAVGQARGGAARGGGRPGTGRRPDTGGAGNAAAERSGRDDWGRLRAGRRGREGAGDRGAAGGQGWSARRRRRRAAACWPRWPGWRSRWGRCRSAAVS